MKVIGVKYDGPEMDFELLMEQYTNALFIFNDNENDHHTAVQGGGNAAVRIYNRYSDLEIPLSAGIPTGKNGRGYHDLNEGKEAIDYSFEEIKTLIEKYGYDTVVYSCNTYDSPLVGTGIFKVDKEVLEYITNLILSLVGDDEYYSLSKKEGLIKRD